MSDPLDNNMSILKSTWKNRNIKCRLLIDGVLDSINRTICHIASISIRKEMFKISLLNTEQTQIQIKSLISEKQSFAIVRFGLYEAMLCKQFLEKQNGLRRNYSQFICNHIDVDAGMFTDDNDGLDSYASFVLSMLPKADGIAYWSNLPSKLIFSPFYSKHCRHIWVEDLYPFPFWHDGILPNWQHLLRGKRVLIVTSFANTVAKQYTKRSEIWTSPDILPEFELITFQAVQTSAGNRDERFVTWFDAFNYMLKEIKDIDFDLALISCGSYGLPLALALKQEGKKAIQWGGCFQLWFGINGNRWSNDMSIQKYVNNFWCYPSIDETPPNYKNVDNGSYWGP